MGFCYQKNFSNPTLPVDEAQFWALVRATQWNENIDKYRETGDAQLKRKLPAFIFQATFDETDSAKGKVGRWRKQSATRLTGLVVMDIDHVENPRQLFESWGLTTTMTTKTTFNGDNLSPQAEILPELSKLSELSSRILLVYITPSGHGLKIVFKARTEWGNLIDNQHAMAEVLGVEVDESCKDASRMSFICKESDILFIDKELFTYENKEFAERYDALYRDGHSSATTTDSLLTTTMTTKTTINGDNLSPQAEVLPEKEFSPCERPEVERSKLSELSSEKKTELSFKGRPYSEIISEWWKRNGGEPQEGERNVKLYQLAVNLRAICDNNPQKLMQVMPRYGLNEQELRSIVESACKEPPKGISKMMNLSLGPGPSDRSEEDINRWLWDWGEKIEEMMQDFPLLKDICKGLKRNQFTAAVFVAGGLLMTLMTRCTYRFYHRPEELRRLNNSTLIIGDPASGKSFATRLFKLLAAPMVAADKAGIAAINRYKEEMKTKGANKEKPQKPKALFRVHPARTSNAQFIQDMVNAVEVVDGEEMQLHMLTFDTELDNTLTVQKGGSWIDKQSLELKAFHNEEDGQAYSNLDSVVQNFFVTWNYIYTGTPIALKKKVNEQNFGSGLATRLTCIPLPNTNFEMMEREKTVDFESDGRLKEWAFKLDRVKGLLSLDKIVDELYDWTARRMADAKENNSKADEMLLKRCAYHGLNFAAPFIVMRHWACIHQEGNYWCGEFETDDVDWRLTELLVNIQYACQRHYFGAMAEKYFDDQKRDVSANARRKQKTIEAFNRLPEEFTAEDIMRCFGLEGESSARGRARTLLADHLAVKTGEFKDNGKVKALYRKTGTVML